MLTYGKALENGRMEPYAQTDEFSSGGDQFILRMTAIHPYKDYARGSDVLNAHIDYHNLATDATGRWENVQIPERKPQDKNLRRHSVFRIIPALLVQGDSIPSPIFP